MSTHSSVEVVYNAILRNADQQGYLSANIDLLCMWSGYSRSSVKRAIETLKAARRLQVGAKEGRLGGLRFKIETGPKLVQKTGPKLVHENATCNAFQETGSGGLRPPEPEPVSFDPTVFETGPRPTAVPDERGRQWRNAINGALQNGMRHSKDCYDRGRATKECPYCEFVYNRMSKEL